MSERERNTSFVKMGPLPAKWAQLPLGFRTPESYLRWLDGQKEKAALLSRSQGEILDPPIIRTETIESAEPTENLNSSK